MIYYYGKIICALGKQDKDNCQHFIDRGIKHHVCPKKAFCFLFHAVELALLQNARLNVQHIIAKMRSIDYTKS